MRQLRQSTNRFSSEVIRTLTGQDPRRGFRYVIRGFILYLLGDNLVNAYQIWAAEGALDGGQVLRYVILPLIIAVALFAYLQRSERMAGVVGEGEWATPHRGLIWLLSPNPTALEIAMGTIRHHQPVLTHVWVIGTFEHKGIPESYETLQRMVGEQGWDVVWEKIPIKEATIRQGHDAVKQVFAKMPGDFVVTDIVVDITGGTKPLSTGAFIACVDNNWQMSYVETPRDSEGKPAGPPRYIALDVNFLLDVRLENEEAG